MLAQLAESFTEGSTRLVNARHAGALFAGEFVPSYGVVPSSVTPVIVLHDGDWVGNYLLTKETVIVSEVQFYQLTRVEQPIVMPREVTFLRLILREVADIVTSLIDEL